MKQKLYWLEASGKLKSYIIEKGFDEIKETYQKTLFGFKDKESKNEIINGFSQKISRLGKKH